VGTLIPCGRESKTFLLSFGLESALLRESSTFLLGQKVKSVTGRKTPHSLLFSRRAPSSENRGKRQSFHQYLNLCQSQYNSIKAGAGSSQYCRASQVRKEVVTKTVRKLRVFKSTTFKSTLLKAGSRASCFKQVQSV